MIKRYEWESGTAGFIKEAVLYKDITGYHITISKWKNPDEKTNFFIRGFTNKKKALNWFNRLVKMLEE